MKQQPKAGPVSGPGAKTNAKEGPRAKIIDKQGGNRNGAEWLIHTVAYYEDRPSKLPVTKVLPAKTTLVPNT